MEEFCLRMKITSPSLITLRNAMVISSLGGQQECGSYAALPSYMLNRIMILDTNSRRFPQSIFQTNEDNYPKETNTLDFFLSQETEENTASIHPMDVFIYIFIMSHPIFRQILVTQISKCQLSLPLITNSQCHRPTLYLNALKPLFKDYCTSVYKSISVLEDKFPIISFVRIGECCSSRKSQILNQIIGIQNYFFHKDHLGSVKTRYFLDGTVEMAWMFPKIEELTRGIKNEFHISPTPYLILNLRGNAWSFNEQRMFLEEISTLIYVFIPMNQCNDSTNISGNLVNFNKEFGSKSIYLLYRGDAIVPHSCNKNKIENNIPDFLKKMSKVVLVLRENLATDSNYVSRNILENIQNIQNKSILISLIETLPIARKYSIYSDIDEHNIQFCQSMIDNIMEELAPPTDSEISNNSPLAILKDSLLPLQCQSWPRWAEAKRTMNNFEISENFTEFQKMSKEKMDKARKEQFLQLQSPSKFLTKIINHCRSYGTFNEDFYIFWKMLQEELNIMCKRYLPPLYDEYRKLHVLSCSHQPANEEEKEIQSYYKDSLISSAKTIAKSSFEIEHVFRELGQVFEVFFKP